jgi:hypothetical protein
MFGESRSNAKQKIMSLFQEKQTFVFSDKLKILIQYETIKLLCSEHGEH